MTGIFKRISSVWFPEGKLKRLRRGKPRLSRQQDNVAFWRTETRFRPLDYFNLIATFLTELFQARRYALGG